MKRYSGLILFLIALSVTSGYLLSKVPLIGRIAMHFEAYSMYTPLKTWWKGAIFVFTVLMILLLVQHIMDRWFKNAKIAHFVCLVLAICGLIYMYNDFRDDYSHRWMRERFHIGGYLLWVGWICISLFFLFTKRPEKASMKIDLPEKQNPFS